MFTIFLHSNTMLLIFSIHKGKYFIAWIKTYTSLALEKIKRDVVFIIIHLLDFLSFTNTIMKMMRHRRRVTGTRISTRGAFLFSQ